jgi:hypothetical protein
MKFVLPFLFSAAIAVPLDILPQATPAATRIHELAIVPTTAGQIGINPPPDDPVFVFTSGDVPGKVSWDRYAQEKWSVLMNLSQCHRR